MREDAEGFGCDVGASGIVGAGVDGDNTATGPGRGAAGTVVVVECGADELCFPDSLSLTKVSTW
jgi:hypothetical protein